MYTQTNTHPHTHTHPPGGGFSFSADVSAWPDAVGGVCFAANTLGFGLVASFFLVDGCVVENVSKRDPRRWDF
jgi:hypothetical protein